MFRDISYDDEVISVIFIYTDYKELLIDLASCWNWSSFFILLAKVNLDKLGQA